MLLSGKDGIPVSPQSCQQRCCGTGLGSGWSEVANREGTYFLHLRTQSPPEERRGFADEHPTPWSHGCYPIVTT